MSKWSLIAVGIVALACVAAPLAAARDKVAIPPPQGGPVSAKGGAESAGGAATRPSWPPIPQETLQQMYRSELGEKYDPTDAQKLYLAHQVLEDYFQSATASERGALAERLKTVGLSPDVVGRLTRLRMYWPALDGGSIYYVNELFGPHTVRYFFGVPAGYDRTKPWALVIKLPTANAFLTNPPPDADGVVRIYSSWISEELKHHPDAVVLMPLLNLDELYGPSYAGMNSVIQPMLHVADRVNIDPARVYMLGHSMAGHAVWNLALHYSTYFAAVNPLAGGANQEWQRVRLVNLRNTLPVVWHDAVDPILPVNFSRTIVRSLRDLHVDVEYDETKGLGHAPSAEVADREYDKMRSRTRELYPQQIWLQSTRPDTMFNRLDWVQVWQEVNTGGEDSVLFRLGTGHMILYKNAYRVVANQSPDAPNHFDLTTSNVESLRLYVNDQTIDFSKPVVVSLNKKPKFAGIVKPDMDVMLRDQAMVGRGWRYFTGVIDIDVVPPVASTTRPTTGPTTRAGKHGGVITIGP